MNIFPVRCEAFPTYPRTYDLVHAEGLLSLETGQQRRCTMLDLFIEVDRLLRPEVHNSNSQLFEFVKNYCAKRLKNIISPTQANESVNIVNFARS